MKIFNNLEEMEHYYNEETNTYIFSENNRLIDIKIDFCLNIECGINALDINALNINARYINTGNINASNINAWDINAWNIKARDIKAENINALDIRAENINANNIRYNSVCYARQKFVCNSIKGSRPTSKHFCLDSEIVINCVD